VSRSAANEQRVESGKHITQENIFFFLFSAGREESRRHEIEDQEGFADIVVLRVKSGSILAVLKHVMKRVPRSEEGEGEVCICYEDPRSASRRSCKVQGPRTDERATLGVSRKFGGSRP